MYLSIVSSRGNTLSDTEREGVAFATEHDGCLWTRHATQVQDTVGYQNSTFTRALDTRVEYWLSRWESVERHENLLVKSGLPEVISKSANFVESVLVVHSVLGPDNAISEVLSSLVIEVVIIKVNTRTTQKKHGDTLQKAFGIVEAVVVGRKENTRGSLTGLLVEHKSSLHDYMNGKPGGLILIGLESAEASVFVKFPTLYNIVRRIGSIDLNQIMFSR